MSCTVPHKATLSFSNPRQKTQAARDAYYNKNYPDFFATIDKTLIKKADGTFMLVSAPELEALRKGGKLIMAIPKTKGGKMVDYTQKPIMLLKE